MLYNNVLETIGHTPLIRLNKVCAEIKAKVYAKVESFNPGNSIKDRIAVNLIDDAEKKGILKPGGTIVEGTSGNTGMGLALVAIVRGYRCIFTTNDKQSKEKIDILKALGAEVIVCPTDVAADDPRSYYSVAKKIHEETPNSFYVNQYFNLSNLQAHYKSTGPEIWQQTGGRITHFVAGVGTGGTISGTARYLKEKNPNITVWGIDTYGSALKKFHETGHFDMSEVYSYITEGIGEDIIPDNVDFSIIDYMEKVTDKEGALMARQITRKEGIFAGYSSGSAVAGLLHLKDRLKDDDLVVVIFPDHGSRYVAKLYNDEWMRERRFLQVNEPTASEIIARKELKKFVTIDKNQTLKEAINLMRDLQISQLPVVEDSEVIGSINEHNILSYLLENPNKLTSPVKEIMVKPFPMIDEGMSCKEISTLINKDNSAVMVKNANGQIHIITEYDLIQSIATK